MEVKPAPDSEKEALAAWKDAELLDFLQGNDGYAPEEKIKAGMNKAVNFLQSHGGSIYVGTAKKGLLDYLTRRAERKRLTPEEQVIYERLSVEP